MVNYKCQSNANVRYIYLRPYKVDHGKTQVLIGINLHDKSGSHHNQRMLYQMCQSTQRKLQKLGPERQYRTNEALSFFCGMMDGLAFVPLCDMGNANAFLRSVTPTNGRSQEAILNPRHVELGLDFLNKLGS
ncbi:uncharacterized protein LOC135927968 isoform X2 [Gordionus sp. m RMFG-2023]|uniref:uncharacterized protein LOC135927968 isoform X2 n=1 Tax=Gordionus sp. m RMFG-2023 TaxID=3053472 RepID=UPI0031FD9D1D